jgi:hypothetical protein
MDGSQPINPYLTGNFAPIHGEDDFDLEVTGEMTAKVGLANTATAHGGFWLEVSSLARRQRIVLPLCATPYLTPETPFAKSVVVFPRHDRWVVQLVDKRPVTQADGSLGKVGVDVGLNVVAAETDAEARFLASSGRQSFASLRRRPATRCSISRPARATSDSRLHQSLARAVASSRATSARRWPKSLAVEAPSSV